MKPDMLGCDGVGRLVFSGLTTTVTGNTTKIITAPYSCTLPIGIGHSHSKHFISRSDEVLCASMIAADKERPYPTFTFLLPNWGTFSSINTSTDVSGSTGGLLLDSNRFPLPTMMLALYCIH